MARSETYVDQQVYNLLWNDFNPKTLCEKQFKDAVFGNRVADCSAINALDPSRRSQGVIRADFILLGLKLLQFNSYNVASIIHIEGARITGNLVLGGQTFDQIISFKNSEFDGDINMNFASIKGLVFRSCSLKSIEGVNAKINDTFLLNDVNCEKRILLQDSIVGEFYGDDSVFGEGNGPSVSISKSHISHSISLKRSRANGAIDLAQTIVEGDVTIIDSKIKGNEKNAINANSLKCTNLTIENTNITGSVDIHDATVEQVVSFQASSIIGKYDTYQNSLIAIQADRIEAKRGILFRFNFKAEGMIQLSFASTKGDIDFSTSSVSNSLGATIVLNSCQANSIRLSRGFKSKGTILAEKIVLQGDFDCDGGVFDARIAEKKVRKKVKTVDKFHEAAMKDITALKLINSRINGNIQLSKFKDNHDSFDLKSYGSIDCLGIAVGGSIISNGGFFYNPNGDAISAERAKISGSIFLRNRTVSVGSINLVNCEVGADLECGDSCFYNLSKIAISANSMHAMNVFINKGCYVQGVADLSKSKIEKDFDCSGSCFINSGKSILLDSCSVGADFKIFSTNEQLFYSNQISALGAKITGNINGSGALLVSNDVAFLGDRVNVGGSILFRNGFITNGTVQMRLAKVVGDFDCSGGQFSRGVQYEDKYSVDVQGIEAKRVFLKNGFVSYGRVQLMNALIHGPIECSGGIFINENDVSVDISNATIDGNLDFSSYLPEIKTGLNNFLIYTFISIGGVRITNTRVLGVLNASGAQIYSSNYSAVFANSSEFRGVVLNDGFYTTGLIDFSNAIIHGDFNCQTAKLYSRTSKSIDLTAAKISGDLLLNGILEKDCEAVARYFRAFEMVNLNNVTVDGNVNAVGSMFLGSNCAVVARSSVVNGNVWLNKDRINGCVDFSDSTIKYNFVYGVIDNNEKLTLKFKQASVGVFHCDTAFLPSKGKLFLDGLVYSNINLYNSRTGKEFPKSIEPAQEFLERQYKITGQTMDESSHGYNLNFSTQPYTQLVKIFSEAGYESKARDISVLKYLELASSDLISFKDIVIIYAIFILQALVVYNVIVLLAGVCVIILGYYIFKNAEKYGFIGLNHFDKSDAKPPTDKIDRLVFSPFFFSVVMFIPFIAHYSNNKWSFDTRKKVLFNRRESVVQTFYISYYFLHRALGGVVCFILSLVLAFAIKNHLL
jgi:hypothetical protein